MEGDIGLPVKLEIGDYDQSNGYGEPLAKRANTTASSQPSAPAAALSSASRNQSSGTADANVTLWQFLLDLLLKQQYSSIICWTNNEGEFKLLDAEQVAKLWGLKKNKNNMNYDKLSRALRYYYDKNIIKKVMGQKFVYKFVSFPEMVKTENRIPFKKKMESMVNDSNPATSTPLSTAMSSFQTLRPYDVKAGLIHPAQLAATALAQQRMLREHAVAQVMAERKYQIPAEHMSMYHANSTHAKLSPVPTDDRSLSRSPTPVQPSVISQEQQDSVSSSTTPPVTLPATSEAPIVAPLHQLSPPVTPVSVCTPAASPSPTRLAYELPGSNTPTPPPKPVTPLKPRDSEVKVKLEIPDIEDRKSSERGQSGGIEGRRSSKQSKVKPDPLSINNDAVVNPSVTSPLMTRGILGSLNTPMFMTSPLYGQRTPLIPGIHLWGPGTLSPVALSPRFSNGLPTGPAFQFPAFAVSPATLASFNSFHDSVFTSSSATGSAPSADKKSLY